MTPAFSAEVEKRLRQFNDYKPEAHRPVRELTMRLEVAGYTVIAPEKSTYLRFNAPRAGGEASFYLNTSGLSGYGVRDIAFLETLPGADSNGKRVMFAFSLGLDALVAVAEALRDRTT